MSLRLESVWYLKFRKARNMPNLLVLQCCTEIANYLKLLKSRKFPNEHRMHIGLPIVQNVSAARVTGA